MKSNQEMIRDWKTNSMFVSMVDKHLHQRKCAGNYFVSMRI
ncbi:hypothetical protein [Clostridium estertheticum]|nr:hypothetical protein [Clostridium estertheticum]